MIDDITMLREGWGDREPPSPQARDRARTALLARIAQADGGGASQQAPRVVTPRRRLPGWAWRSGLATLGVAAVVAGAVVTGGLGQDAPAPGGGSASRPLPEPGGSIARTFELAAVHAEAEPFTPPRPDQWTYVELTIVRGKIARDKGQATRETTRSWRRADGRQSAMLVDGRLEIGAESPDIPQTVPPQDYPTLAGLPTDPRALLDRVRSQFPEGKGDPARDDVVAYSVIGAMLRDNVLPPGVKATLLRAMALIPGVTRSADPVDFDGRPAIAIGLVADGWRREDVMIDPTTHEFLGSRTLVVEDHTTPQGVRLKKGDVEVELVRVSGRIVDAPGHTS
ncbi:CU044_5270 family protein [Micromonospora sp. URMC 103]|uniref:CU044_5270 family protein n=1 Tax=Micromonospora sp. URMC 103 TaxID=3423406 RepID=UPI003F1AF576